MGYRQTGILLLCIFWISNSYGQLYNFKTYAYEQGLPESGINALCEDVRGNLWIGTANAGLIRFDGHNFYPYTIGDRFERIPINTILEEQSGRLLIGTDSGAFTYDGKRFGALGPLANVAITSSVRDHSGNVWIGTRANGLYRYNGKTLDKVGIFSGGITVNAIRYLYSDSQNRLWIGTSNGVISYDGRNFKFFSATQEILFNDVNGIEEDSDKNLWFATDKGIFKFDGEGFVNIPLPHDSRVDRIYSVSRDGKNNLWFSTPLGIFRYSANVFRLYTISTRQENVTRYSYRDPDGNLWFGMSHGLAKLESERFIRYTENSHLGRQVFSIIQSINGNIMCSTSLGGITILDGQQFSLLDEREGFTSSVVQSLYYSPDSSLWVGTQDDGIFRFSKSNVNHYSRDEGFRFNNISGFAVDDSQNIWVASADSGVVVIQAVDDSLKVIKKYNQTNGLPSNQITSLINDGTGNLWLGTAMSGIIRITPKGDSVSIANFSSKDGVSGDVVHTLITDSLHRIYIGTSRGITFYDGTKFQSLTKSNGLSANTIYSLALDHQNNLWAGTERGVDRISLTKNFTHPTIEHFGAREGFDGTEVYRNATCVDREGNVWFGTINGLIKYDRGYDLVSTKTPRILITGIKLFFDNIEDTRYGDSLMSWFPIPPQLELPYNQNNLTFSFAGIYLRNPKAVRYKWMLEGFNQEWSPELKDQEAVFSNIPPGDYTFKVIACNENNVWTTDPATFRFSVIPPIWQRWWAKTLAGVGFISIVWMIFYIRVKNIKTKNRIVRERLEMEKSILELEQEAARLQMNPHFIFNCLNSIQGFISIHDALQAKKYLAKFAKLMRLILENAREEFIPLQNEINILENYMELEKLSTNPKFEFSVTTDESINPERIQIPPMMIQPIVENAIIHGIRKKPDPGFISIHFHIDGDVLRCAIRDNGIGRRKAAEINAQTKSLHKSTAISITQKRLQQYSQYDGVQAGIEIIDLVEDGIPTGTLVNVSTPYETF